VAFNRKPLGLKELGKLDWQRRLDAYADLKGKNLTEHKIVDGLVDGKVPLQQILDRVARAGLKTVVEDDMLYITVLKRVS
jgi:hypothetical protein